MTTRSTRKSSKSTTRPAAAPKVPAMVQLLLNGQVIGEIQPGTQSIGAAAVQVAKDHGLKTFSILVNGQKVLEGDATKALAGARSLEVFAKEARG